MLALIASEQWEDREEVRHALARGAALLRYDDDYDDYDYDVALLVVKVTIPPMILMLKSYIYIYEQGECLQGYQESFAGIMPPLCMFSKGSTGITNGLASVGAKILGHDPWIFS